MRAPVVISGLGGSGTRVAAIMARAAGVEMGRDTNSADDDLLFTLLLKRRRLVRAALTSAVSEPVDDALQVHEVLRGVAPLSGRLPVDLVAAAWDAVARGHERRSAVQRAAWVARRGRGLVARRRSAGRWGFKEPTAHLYLPHLVRRHPDLEYVHVLRNPADYAVKPHNQFLAWGPLLGEPVPSRAEDLPQAQLRYWVRANLRALRLAQQAGVLRAVVRLEDAMTDPLGTARTVAAALGAHPDEEALRRAAAAVVAHPSRGRGDALDLAALLSPEDLDAVRDLGY